MYPARIGHILDSRAVKNRAPSIISEEAIRCGSELSETMGRTSKFSFPVPGRKHAATTKEKEKAPGRSPLPSGLSKAQRILGTDSDLNIDSPNRDDDDMSWRYPSSTSSNMSISISESTQSMQSTNETGSLHGSVSEQWDRESGVFPRSRLPGKASSTLLGQTYVDDAATDTSSVSRRMRHEDSSSTLKSYYDRQKSPLAISQQTSESSARDLALRKGYPTVVSRLPRSPLLQVESSVDIFEEHFANGLQNLGDLSREKSTRKKPARLDLSTLFSSRRKRTSKISNGELQISSPSSLYSNAPTTDGTQNFTGPRKLTKAQSKESLRSQQPSVCSTKSYDPRPLRQTSDTLSSLYDSYEQLALSPPMSQIPESRVPDPEPERWNDRRVTVQRRNRDSRERPVIPSRPEPRTKSREHQKSLDDSHARRRIDSYAQPRQLHRKDQDTLSPADKEPFSWKHVRESMISPPWDSSAASISSRNTKTSRHTSASAFSNSDLKQSSVLSLSSDSEEEASDRELMRSPAESSNDKASRILNGGSNRPVEARRQSSQPPEKVAPKKQSSRKGAAHPSPFLTIPETTATTSRLSGPWSPPKLDNSQSGETTRSSDKREKRSKKTQSASSKRSSNQPTPPLSPKSNIVQDAETDSSRFMAVTKQEEALLEGLRQKRARMREKIIEEHETQKPPPRAPDRKTSRHSESSSVNTIRGPDIPNDKHRILLYLDTPLNDGHFIDTAEPSPDLSDFLSFGSDEDSTPRTSWAPPRRGQPRPDSSVSPDPRSQKFSPATPPSVARLSAVGASAGFRNSPTDPTLVAKKRNTNAGVRFVDDAKLVHPQDFLLDENEEGVIWGM